MLFTDRHVYSLRKSTTSDGNSNLRLVDFQSPNLKQTDNLKKND